MWVWWFYSTGLILPLEKALKNQNFDPSPRPPLAEEGATRARRKTLVLAFNWLIVAQNSLNTIKFKWCSPPKNL